MSFSMDYTYAIVKCNFCDEEILVERFLFGIDHTSGTLASHKKCIKLPLDKKFVKDNPAQAKAIGKWLKGKKTNA